MNNTTKLFLLCCSLMINTLAVAFQVPFVLKMPDLSSDIMEKEEDYPAGRSNVHPKPSFRFSSIITDVLEPRDITTFSPNEPDDNQNVDNETIHQHHSSNNDNNMMSDYEKQMEFFLRNQLKN